MPKFVVHAIIECPRLFSSKIGRRLALELEKPRYRRLGIRLEKIDVVEMAE